VKVTRGIAVVLALVVVGTGCARLNPRASEEYKSKAKAAHQVLTYQDGYQEWQKETGSGEMIDDYVRYVAEARHALNASTRAQETWGDRRLHKQLLAYSAALGEEEIAIFAAGEGMRKPWKQELAARLAELDAKKKEARQKLEASLR